MSGKQAKKHDSDHAQEQRTEEKTHGDPLDAAVSSAGEHAGEQERGERNSAIPEAETGGHPRSAAAHLGGHTHDHTKPVGDMRKYEAEREPPQEVSRAGKEYRRQ